MSGRSENMSEVLPAVSPGGLFELLAEAGAIDQEDLARALEFSEKEQSSAPDAVTRLGLMSEVEVAGALAEALKLERVGVADLPDLAVLGQPLNVEFLKTRGVVPVASDQDTVTLAMVDPTDRYAIKALALLTGLDVRPKVAARSDILAAIRNQYGGGNSEIDELSKNAAANGSGSSEPTSRTVVEHASDAPVVRLVNVLISKALDLDASDIHIEPFEGRFRIRYRIDGVLHETEAPPAPLATTITARIKVMAGLDIAERRLPQDGRIKIVVKGNQLDIRVSTVPGLNGERLVLRLLRQEGGPKNLRELGFEPSVLDRLHGMLRYPHGLMLVTGPTGSGKTTTLYGALKELPSHELNILTVEDPVEYQMPGLGQIQVKADIGLGFANILRSVLRQDPDVIMIGEIRDAETAEIAVHAALTGHLVLSTLHTNTAAGAITRLLEMGVQDYLAASCLIGVLAQRLVRRLCGDCKIAKVDAASSETSHSKGRGGSGGGKTYHAKGCERCGGSGYRGRMVISEVMPASEQLRAAIANRPTTEALQKIAVNEGMSTMTEGGYRLIESGETSLAELGRVTGFVL